MTTINQAGVFLIVTIFNLYIWVLMLRLILHWVRANYFNPISQLIIKLTNIFVKPLKKVIPSIRNLETATLIVLIVIGLIKLLLLSLLTQSMPGPISLIIGLLASLVSQLLNLYFFMIIIAAIASWFAASYHNPALQLLQTIIEPILRPVRKIIPPVAGFDLSPIVILIAIKLIDILVVIPLFQAALRF